MKTDLFILRADKFIESFSKAAGISQEQGHATLDRMWMGTAYSEKLDILSQGSRLGRTWGIRWKQDHKTKKPELIQGSGTS